MRENQAHKPPFDPARAVRRVTWIGMLANLVLAGFKFFAGFWGGSRALVADAVHSLSDSSTDIAVIVGSHFWYKPPDADHPHGHRRIETLVTLFIGLVLLGAGLGIGWQALKGLYERHTHPPRQIALIAAAVSMVVKEALYQWTAAVGKQVKSQALFANAWHHRLDALSSIPAFAAIGGAILFPRWAFLDLVGAALVSAMILHAALKIIWPGLKEFTDAGAPPEVREQIYRIAARVPGVESVHRIRSRYIGSGLQVDLHLRVNGDITVYQGHAIAGKVKSRLMRQGPDIVDVLIHIEPS